MGVSNKILSFFKTIILEFVNFNRGIFQAMREQSVETLEQEYLDLEMAFLTMILGGIIGIPLIPGRVARELLPLVADEIKIMEKRAFLGTDVIADYFSTLGGEW